MTNKKATFHWDGDLEIEIEWNIPALKRQISDSIEDKFENTTGALSRSINIREGSHTSLLVSSDKDYALIHEYGGTVPERFPKAGGVLHWMDGLMDVFARHASAFNLPAKGYVKDAFEKWVRKDLNIRWKDQHRRK